MKRLLITFFSASCILIGSYVAIRFAQGDRATRSGIVETGLLAANSFPNGASIYINGNFTSATDTTLNLSPGDYDIEIKKDGYSSWKKRLRIEKELVSQTNAVLFPSAPSLSPLSVTGAENITPSSDGQQLLFTTTSASASKANGIYVLDLSESPLALQKGPRQIAVKNNAWDFTKTVFLWSPDSTQILLYDGSKAVVLTASRLNDLDTLPDKMTSLKSLLATWEDEMRQKQNLILAKFPPEIVAIATGSAQAISISPDQERLLYTATASSVIKDSLISSLPASNTQLQKRTLVAGETYVYDRHEDRNFLISTSPQPTPVPTLAPVLKKGKQVKITPKTTNTDPVMAQITLLHSFTSPVFAHGAQWLSDSKHVVIVQNDSIDIIEYDGTNLTQVYTGPFAKNFVYPWPNGSKLAILTNFNQRENVPLNLYAVGLK